MSTGFRTFSSMDEMIEYMERGEVAANQSVLPSQAKIGWGDHFMRLADDILIFGSIYTREAAMEGCRKAGGSPEECRWEDERLVDAHGRGYRFGSAYSVVVPDGELGSTHISTMVPITAEQFAEAREDGWDLDRVSARPWFIQAALLITIEAREHAQ